MSRITHFELGSDDEMAAAFSRMAARGINVDVDAPIVVPLPLRPVLSGVAKKRIQSQATAANPTTGSSGSGASAKPGFFDALAQLTGIIGGTQSFFSNAIAAPQNTALTDFIQDPDKIEDFLKSEAWTAASGLIKTGQDAGLSEITDSFLSAVFGGASPKNGGELMGRIPTGLTDPVGWLTRKIDSYLTPEKLASLGLDQAFDFGSDALTKSLGLTGTDDTSSAGTQIASTAASKFLLPELKSYLKSQILGLLKDKFPETFSKVAVGDAGIEDRIQTALGLDGDAGCVPIAVCFDAADHKGLIVGPCSPTVFAGGVPVARVGDKFACITDAVSAPIVEGVESVVVEGQAIAPHLAKTACGAKIQASGLHQVWVADSAPPASASAADPEISSNDAPATADAPQVDVEEPATAADDSADEQPDIEDEPPNSAEFDELNERVDRLADSAATARDDLFAWIGAKMDLSSAQSRLAEDQDFLETIRDAQRDASEELTDEMLKPILGDRAPWVSHSSDGTDPFDAALGQIDQGPLDEEAERSGAMQNSLAAEGFEKAQAQKAAESANAASEAQNRENQAAIDFSNAVLDMIHETGDLIFVPLDQPISPIKDAPR